MHLCIDCICIHAYSPSQASQQGGGGGKDAAKESDKDARNIGKDAIEAMAGMPGNTGKDADAL
ncbi:hypothetical protein FFI16_020650 [Pseudomonas sp. KBS0710]|nr:hypothetical protein FFI16_020650 [Pseudomonas sp. KBS0710]